MRFWRSVEFFSPQNIPKVSPRGDFNPIFEVNACTPIFPWEASHTLKHRKINPKKKWQHTVYCVVYPHSLLKENLQKKFGNDELTFDERIDGESCVFAFNVSETGRPLFDTFTLSSSAWGLSQLINSQIENSNWVDNFEKDKSKIHLEFASICKLEDEDYEGHKLMRMGQNIGKALVGVNLIDLIFAMLKSLKLKLEDNLRCRVKSVQIGVKNYNKIDDLDFLNSFFINDLKKVSTAVDKDNFGKALRKYLSSPADLLQNERINVRKEPWQVFHILKPELFPQGSWPSMGHHPLVLSQQFAVNAIFKTINSDEGGIFAVNGPPGTGKTTLLRDLVAGVIVERAKILEKYDDPTKVFAKQNNTGWKSEKYNRVIAQWPKEFAEFSLVVSSSNNGAVENISLEIPGKNAIDPDWELECDYFRDLASSILQQPAWGLIAARLGNKTNRNTFIQKFWYGLTKNDDDEEDKEDNDLMNSVKQELSLLKVLKDYETNLQNLSWKEALKNFRAAIQEEKVFRKERDDWYRLLSHIQEIKVKQDCLASQICESLAELNWLEKETTSLYDQKTSVENELGKLNISYFDSNIFCNQLNCIIKILYQILGSCNLNVNRLQKNSNELNVKLVALHNQSLHITKELEDSRNQLSLYVAEANEKDQKYEIHESSRASLENDLNSIKEQRYEHRQFYPKFLSIVITLCKAYKDWNNEDQSILEKIKEKQESISILKKQQLLLAEQISTTKNKISSLQKQIGNNENLEINLLDSCRNHQNEISQFKDSYLKLADRSLILGFFAGKSEM